MGKIGFISYKHDSHIRICMLPSVLQPARKMIKSFSPELGKCINEYIIFFISDTVNNITQYIRPTIKKNYDRYNQS